MNTPWGQSQDVERFARGISFVSTAGHGGMMIAKGIGEKLLTASARARAELYGGYYAYEEDCLYAIPFYELITFQHWPTEKLFKYNPQNKTAEQHKYDLWATISNWNSDYLLEIGVTPEVNGYTHWRERQLSDKMRAEKHPDLIVSWFEQDGKGGISAITADDKRHWVTLESYDQGHGYIKLLSKCVPYNPNLEPLCMNAE